MADPIGITSGIVALATFALQSSIALSQTIRSFQSQKRSIRELKDELEALEGALTSLRDSAGRLEGELAPLKLPLQRCSESCVEFRALLEKCSKHSGQPRTSFKDWAKLQYMGGDITNFKNMLAGYKATIQIAIGDATLRTARVTAQVLDEYKSLIEETTQDLRDHLEDIERKLGALSRAGNTEPASDVTRRQVEQERRSTQQCLDICTKMLAHIDEIYSRNFDSESGHESNAPRQSSTRSPGSAQHFTANTISSCKSNLSGAISYLQKYLETVDAHPPEQQFRRAEHIRMSNEADSIRQALAICSSASDHASGRGTNSIADSKFADDGHHVFVSTIGDLFNIKGLDIGHRTTTWVGQLSDETVQQLSRDRHVVSKATSSPTPVHPVDVYMENPAAPTEPWASPSDEEAAADEKATGRRPGAPGGSGVFEGRYGLGYSLN